MDAIYTHQSSIRSQKLALSKCLLATLISLTVTACGIKSNGQSQIGTGTTLNTAPNQYAQDIHNEQGDDHELIQAQDAHMINVEVTGRAMVKKLLPDDLEGLQHQKFLLILSNGTTVLVAHNTQMAPRVPIQPGDVISIRGSYIWNAKGGLIHWTHHTDTPRHDGGWIDFQGQRYQ